MEFNLKKLSDYRVEFMGLSAIAILFCHAAGNNVLMPSFLHYFFALGRYGVDVFLFMSGLGLWYSLTQGRIKRGGVLSWYLKRYKRLLVPFCIIVIPYYIIFCLLKQIPLSNLFYYISTLSFWKEHEGQWFVDALIPLYLFAPFLYKLINSKYRHLAALLLCLLCVLFSFIPNHCSNPYMSILGNLQFVISRVPSFIFGMWLAPYIIEGRKIRYPFIISIISTVIFIVLYHYNVPSSFFTIIPLLFLFYLFIYFQSLFFKKVFTFIGKVSLESYLFNVTLPFFLIKRVDWVIGDYNIGYGNIIPYVCVVVLGTFLSYVVNKISNRIIYFKR